MYTYCAGPFRLYRQTPLGAETAESLKTLGNNFNPIIALIGGDALLTKVMWIPKTRVPRMGKETRMYMRGRQGEDTLDSNSIPSASDGVASIHPESL